MDDLILILAVVLPTVAFGIWWVLRPAKTQSSKIAPKEELPAILFRNGVLEHATDAAIARLPIAIGAHSWEDIHDILQTDFPDFPAHPLPTTSNELTVKGTSGSIHITWLKNGISLIFHGLGNATDPSSESEELVLLRQINDHLPFPAWKTGKCRTVIWHNAAYADLCSRMDQNALVSDMPIFTLPEVTKGGRADRAKVNLSGEEKPVWFSITNSALPCGTIFQATPLTDLIKAEEAQRDFVQTLAKTFAHLSTGLAIFNRDRQLALFNPALIDLTGLSVSFLSPRPTIDSFFDAMRENRRMPEPKNYKTWRHRMADLISAAEVGRFEETWSLETGQTYRVTGRPHPDGAIAFLMEDISAEVSLTRNFRAELELGQSLVDTFEDALAVFSQSGVLTFSNKAYDLLWGFEGDSSFADVTITDAVQLWREKSAPNPMWQELKEAVMTLGDREEWTMPVCLKGQKPMQCRIVPIASGATVVRFSRNQAAKPSPQKLSRKVTD